jgi:hypothetical protein
LFIGLAGGGGIPKAIYQSIIRALIDLFIFRDFFEKIHPNFFGIYSGFDQYSIGSLRRAPERLPKKLNMTFES